MKGTARLLRDMPEQSHNFGELGKREDYGISLLIQKHSSIKQILRSYGVSTNTKAPQSVIDNMIDRGTAQNNERLCPCCYKIFDTGKEFCPSCRKTRNGVAKIKDKLRKSMKLLK